MPATTPKPTPEQSQLAILAVELILTHGIPVFMTAMQTLKTAQPTLAEIHALRDAVKDPESYFKGIQQ